MSETTTEGSGRNDECVQEEGEEENSSTTDTLNSVCRNLLLHPTVWQPSQPARALLYISHGVGEYMGRYDALASVLADSGIIVFGHDHVGHGKSEGDRVHIDEFDIYIQDVIRHVEMMKQQHSHLPCILLGHSMGGLVAAHTILRRPDLFTSAVLSGTPVEVEAPFNFWIIKKVFGLLSHIAPQLGVKNLDTSHISSIPEEVDMYVNDPLIWHGAMKARWGVGYVTAVAELQEKVAGVSLPLLLIHGSDDGIIPVSSAHFLYANVSSNDKTLEVFEGSRHEVLHDKEQERARDLIRDWVLSHLTSLPPPPPPSSDQPESESAQTDEKDTQKNEETEQSTDT